MTIATLIDGETAVEAVTCIDYLAAIEPAEDWVVTAIWLPIQGLTPEVPVCSIYDLNTWRVVASSTGLGGQVPTLRVTATHTVSGRVLKANTQYLVTV